ncbi:arginine-tRNA-protein transferase [Ilyonectria robusta]
MYRPDQRRSCCPHYTIRLDSSQFKPSRAQRQTLNRFNKYVVGDSYGKEAARLHPKSRDQAKKRDNHFDLVERIHEAEDAKLLKPPEAAHKLVVTLENDDFTEEKYTVYKNYQQVVHKDDPAEISRKGFKGFLCNSPLRRETMIGSNGRERRLGSYHHCYRLDGKLVAMGVLDLLPDCVSSVYFLYDESIHKLAPGKLGALYEIALSLEEGYGWWYPGFYIHSCPKMRSEMPGIPSLSSIITLDMDRILLKITPDGPLYKTSDLVSWEQQTVEQWPGLRAGVAELVAAIGPDLMDQICLDFVSR